jgi:hypothetical protein
MGADINPSFGALSATCQPGLSFGRGPFAVRHRLAEGSFCARQTRNEPPENAADQPFLLTAGPRWVGETGC